MSGCSSRVENQKILKTDGGDEDDGASTSDYSKTRDVASDFVGESSSGSTSAMAKALQNRVILHHLFELCPADVLATCRLVCKEWYEESLVTWRNSSPLRFTYDNGHMYMEYNRLRAINYEAWDTVQLPLQTLLEYAAEPKNQCQKKPYRYIGIKYSTIGNDRANRREFEILWNAFGSNLTTLELKKCTFHDDEELRKIIFSHCPKLQRLIIDRCKFSEARNVSVQELHPVDYKEQRFEPNNHLKVLKIVEFTPVSWLELFSHFPLMSTFSVSTFGKMTTDVFDSLTKAIRTIRKRDGNLLPFKVFDIDAIRISSHPLGKQRFPILQELRLPLQRELYVFAEPGTDEVFFRDVIAFGAKTLTELHLVRWIPTASFSGFPFGHQLDNVTTLSVVGCFAQYLQLLKCMPNIEELSISETGGPELQKMTFSNTDNAELAHLKMPKLTRLDLHCKLEDDDFAKLHNWMPNVLHFTIYLNDKQFGIVCEKWTNLKWLNVLGYDLTDGGVVGMKNKTGANIRNLQNLVGFSFQSDKLTSKAVFQGFLQLPILRDLEQLGQKPVRWGNITRQAILDSNIRLDGNLVKWCYPNLG